MCMNMKVKKYLSNLSKYHGNVTEETRYLFTSYTVFAENG